jgi:DNA adenine methylase
MTPRNIGTLPVLKWVGGKRVILEVLRANIVNKDRPLIEPFIGGGALSFSVPTSDQIIIGDLNRELINLYSVVKKSSALEEMIAFLQSPEFKITEANFYKIRQWDRSETFWELSPAKIAARTFYLNKTGFNGIFRVNSKNHFNVPFGHKPLDFEFDFKPLTELQRLLSSKLPDKRNRFRIQPQGTYDVQIEHALASTNGQSVIYLDPPYASTSTSTSTPGKAQSFKTYQKDGFSDDDQLILARFVRNLGTNHEVLLSNVDTESVRDWYRGFYYLVIPGVRRSVSGKASGRSGVDEILLSNHPLNFVLDGKELMNGKL